MEIFNLLGDEWNETTEHEAYAFKDAWVGARIGAELIGGSLYEVAPGKKLWPYHTHHANEEWAIVIRGRPTLRTPGRRARARRGRRRRLPPRPDGGASDRQPDGRARARPDALDAPLTRADRIPGQRQDRRDGREREAALPDAPRRACRVLGRRVAAALTASRTSAAGHAARPGGRPSARPRRR